MTGEQVVKGRISFGFSIDRDEYPLPVDDRLDESIAEDVEKLLEELDGWQFGTIKVTLK